MGCDSLLCKGWTPLLRCGDMSGNQVLGGVGAEASAARTGKQKPGVVLALSFHPSDHDRSRGLGERSGSLLAPFTLATDMSADAERDVLRAQAGQLGQTQA